jgi:hypothetical protein
MLTGLLCGFVVDKCPGMDMVGIGYDMGRANRGEKVSFATTGFSIS